jgi:protein O-mannosyl-transferase
VPSRARRSALLALSAAAAAFLTFIPSLSSAWLNWDDWILVSQNPHVRGFGWENVRWAFTSALGGAYQPLAYLSYALDFTAWGSDARGYHLTNALLHAVCAALLFLVARRVLALARPSAAGEPEGGLDAAALFAALVFAVHPLRVESVSWIAERRDPLCGTLWLGAALAYLRAREPGRAKGSLLPAAGLFAAACLAKGIAVTLPLVLLVLDLWPLRRRFSEAAREKVPMLFLGGALGVLAIARQAGARASWSWTDHGAAARLAQAAFALVFYVRKTVLPAGLSPFYELRPPLDPYEARFLLSAAAVAVFAAAAWRVRRARPAAAAAGAAYLLILLPVSGLLQAGSQLVADRYSYLACVPWAILAGGVFRAALLRSRRTASVLAAGAVLALAAACVAQQSSWRDSEALWRRVLALDADSPTGWINLGSALAGERRTPEAAAAFARALASDPGCPPLVERLERAAARGEGADLRAARAALETRPVCRKALANYGTACAELGEREAARRYLKLAEAADPEDGLARLNLERLENEGEPRARPRSGQPR